MKKIRLKPKHDRRFRSGHPWVYSNELQDSPKGLEPGEALELVDPSGRFLAYGYGNPFSLITFRAVSRDESEKDAFSAAGVARRLDRAFRLREALGFSEVSHRLCFGEADQLPGFILDCYRLIDRSRVLVVQAQTAGADRWAQGFEEILDEWKRVNPEFFRSDLITVIKNDSASRKWEGLELQSPVILKDSRSSQLKEAKIIVRSADLRNEQAFEFNVDLLEGQKTGFFLDQWSNIQLCLSRLEPWLEFQKRRSVRVLDLCCYVGQWSAQISRFLDTREINCELSIVDSSRRALDRAQESLRGIDSIRKVTRIEGNVLHDLGSLERGGFDVIISDPPALIKNRKDIPAGTHAYLQLHTQAARLLTPRGVWVACSCSGLLSEDSFLETLAKACRRESHPVSWIARGGQSPDHPVLAEFPEGRYLKSWMGFSVL